MKIWRMALILTMASVLYGCGDYQITDSRLNQALASQLQQQPPVSRQLALTDEGDTLAMVLVVNDATLDLSGADGGVIHVKLQAELTGELSLFGRAMSVSREIEPEFESGIRLQDNQLYLVSPRLVSVGITGSGFNQDILRSALDPMQAEFEKALANYVKDNPIYTLDHSLWEKGVSYLVSDLQVRDGFIDLILF